MPPESNESVPGNPQPAKQEPANNAPDFTQLGVSISALNENIAKLLAVASQPREPASDPVDDPDESNTDPADEDDDNVDLEEIDLETLSRADLVKLLNSSISGNLVKHIQRNVVEPIEARLNQRDQASMVEVLTNQINTLASENPDYPEWKDEMIKISNENPTLSPVRVYRLAKLENPDKAKILAKKYPSKSEIEARNRSKAMFFNLPPSGSDKGNGSKLSREQAGDAALSEIVSRHGDIFGV